MSRRVPEHLAQSEMFLQFHNLRHGSTMRHFNTRDTDRTEEVRRLQSHLGIPGHYPVVHGDQCHTSTVAYLEATAPLPEDPDQDGRMWILETDALVHKGSGATLAVYSADCVPLLMFDPYAEVIAAVHAGWRGTLGRIAEATARTMVDRAGCDPQDILAWIGPAAGPGYEVSPELAGQFEESFPEFPVQDHRWKKGRYLNLSLLNKLQLASVGLLYSNITLSGIDTLRKDIPFYSYRRDGGPTGRIISSITLLKPEDEDGVPSATTH